MFSEESSHLNLKARSSNQNILRGHGGQIVLEYVLLLVLGVAVAMMITSRMVSRSANNPGFLVKKWVDIINLIGSDTADDVKPQQQ
jgi:hypothetical protein